MSYGCVYTMNIPLPLAMEAFCSFLSAIDNAMKPHWAHCFLYLQRLPFASVVLRMKGKQRHSGTNGTNAPATQALTSRDFRRVCFGQKESGSRQHFWSEKGTTGKAMSTEADDHRLCEAVVTPGSRQNGRRAGTRSSSVQVGVTVARVPSVSSGASAEMPSELRLWRLKCAR